MEQKYCQSCGMPLQDPALLGTERDGSPSQDYCKYCYQDGAFTGEMTMEEMIDFCVPILVQENPALTAEEVKVHLSQIYPHLLRWKK